MDKNINGDNECIRNRIKGKFKKKLKYKFYIEKVAQMLFIILFIFIIIFPVILSKQIKLKSLIFSYEITVIIQNTGEQTIFNGDIEVPFQIIINNGNAQSGSKIVNLDNRSRFIKL